VVTFHLLPEADFSALAEGGGSLAACHLLRDAQLSKHLMLLHAIAEAASSIDRGTTAFRVGYELLVRIQAADPEVGAWLLSLPHLSGWIHDCLIHLEQGSAADFGHFACLVAAAAVRAGASFELDVPVRDDRVWLPGLGSLLVTDQPAWTRLCCDGERITAGDHFASDWRLLVPDDGSGGTVPRWSGTPMIRAVADGLTWDTLLESSDLYLDRYTLPMSAGLSSDELRHWRRAVQSAWDVLVRHHRWTAEPIADGISVIVPLTPQADTDLVSATTPAAFGAIATSWPPDPITLAETLVHEFQHVKLCGLLDMVALTESGGEKVYAPWRQDPRPAASLLQGVYAHLGIARFWQVQRHVESDPDEVRRAQVLFARWRPTIDRAARTLLETDCLTQVGVRFVEILRDQGRRLESEAAPSGALEMAEEVALDHWLTWQMRHMAFESAAVARLARAYQQGESCSEQMRPRAWIEEDTRKVNSTVRSRLMNMRYLTPVRYRQLSAPGALPLSEADGLLLSRKADLAIRAFRDEIVGSTAPRPDAWIGLALALHQVPRFSLHQTFADHLALMFEMNSFPGGRRDPLDLASWLT
jgi:HEXXH motif-containing protein